jgi:hypothetical protein
MAVRLIGSVEIAPGQSARWFIHGFTALEVAHFSITVFPQLVGGDAHATLTQGEKIEHVDLTQAYRIHIQNNSAREQCLVFVLAQVESLQL